jgi:hypothetical protein
MLSKSCQKVLKKSCQKVVKKLSKVIKKLSKKCQTSQQIGLSKFKTSGEDDDDEEAEDWLLQDQVATSSHLVKRALTRTIRFCVGLAVRIRKRFGALEI